jgi:hypothetical protein
MNPMFSREKSARISFVVVLVAFCAYFASISGDLSIPADISHHAAALVGLMAVIIAVTVVEIAAQVWVAELARFGTQIDYYRRGLA